MKIMRIMGLGLLMALWLAMGVCSGGGLAEKTYYQALEQGMQGNFPQAQETLVRALGADPFYAPAKVCLETLQDVTTKKIKPQTAIHVFTAMAYGNHSQWEEFIAEINRALQLDPEYGAAYNHRGNAYDESGQYDRAVADFDQAVALNPSFAEAHFNKAMACEQAGRPQDAAAAYRSFLHYAIDS